MPIKACELEITLLTFFETLRASLVLLLLTHISTAGFPSTNFKILLFSTLDFIFAISPDAGSMSAYFGRSENARAVGL